MVKTKRFQPFKCRTISECTNLFLSIFILHPIRQQIDLVRFQFSPAFVFPGTDLRLSLHRRVHVAMVDQVNDQVLRRGEHVRAHRTAVRGHAVRVFRIWSGMVRPDVLSEDNALVEGPRADSAGVRFFARVDALVFS